MCFLYTKNNKLFFSVMRNKFRTSSSFRAAFARIGQSARSRDDDAPLSGAIKLFFKYSYIAQRWYANIVLALCHPSFPRACSRRPLSSHPSLLPPRCHIPSSTSGTSSPPPSPPSSLSPSLSLALPHTPVCFARGGMPACRRGI